MRWWIIFSCIAMFSCTDETGEKSTPPVTKNITADSAPPEFVDTTASFAKDTTVEASTPVLQIKRPAGIYQFYLPYGNNANVLHTIAFYSNTFHLEEEYQDKKDSIVITDGTWAPSQGFIWLYKDQLVRGRYTWKGDTLQYFSPKLNKKFSMTKLTSALANPAWQNMRKAGAILYGVGTEPFWSIEVKKKDSIILSMPDWGEPLRLKLTGKTKGNKGTVYTTAATDSLRLTVLPYFCNDGMSDFIYSNRLVVSYKGRTLQGCGEVF